MKLWDEDSAIWDQFDWADSDDVAPLPVKSKKINHRTMSSNPTPDNNDVLRALADLLADGCHTYEAAIGIKQNAEAAIRAAITGLTDAELQFGLKKQAVDHAYEMLQAGDAAGDSTLTNCKLRLAQKLGQRWSAAWEPTGFPNQSTAVPRTQDERFTLLGDLKAYFTAVPANESAEMAATAATCDAAWTALSDARQTVADSEKAQTDAGSARGAAANALRKRVRGLISELEGLIENDDSRWEGFGLNIPGNPSAPEAVTSVTAAALGNGRIELAWPYAVRAVRYRVEGKITGVDADFKNLGSFKDLGTILKGFAATQVVQLRIVAGNDGGDAVPSPVGQVTVT